MADLAAGVGALGRHCLEDGEPVGGPSLRELVMGTMGGWMGRGRGRIRTFVAFKMGLLHELGNAGGHAVDYVYGFDAAGNGGFFAAVGIVSR